MKKKMNKLIDLIINSDKKADNQAPKEVKPKKIVWKTRFYRTDPLADPKQDKIIEGQRITPNWITRLDENQIFVFGSNTRGIHDGGASFTAVQYFGAIVGQSEGPQGQSNAIPTDGASLTDIQASVNRFVIYAKAHPHLTFLVTEIGCGTAGYHPMEISPMFKDAVAVPNIYLPKIFWRYLTKV
jgi:hypothetical protein